MALKFTQVFEYKGRKYEVLGTGKSKNTATGAWYGVVIYREEGTEGENFVRDAQDFHKKFTFVRSKQVK